MLDEPTLKRVAESVTPRDELKQKMKKSVMSRIKPQNLLSVVYSATPSSDSKLRLKDRIMLIIRTPLGSRLGDLSRTTNLPQKTFERLRQRILASLEPIALPAVSSAVRWALSFAVFIVLLRAMPLVFLAPAIQANLSVQLIPHGADVSVFVVGIWRNVRSPEILRDPVMIRTGDSSATIILNDDGVVRLKADTTLKLHNTTDNSIVTSAGPTATLVRGSIWTLGLLSPVQESLTIETSQGRLALNSGSASVEQGDRQVKVSVYDLGATFQQGTQTAFIVSGEQMSAREKQPLLVKNLPAASFSNEWVTGNLSQDAAHRTEIAKMLQERRQQMAGILPTSFLYPAKRIAEEVDVLFTLTTDGRTEKRIQQADTRLSEALALLKEGQNSEATMPMTEYRDSLLAMAGGTGDNLVKFLIKKQIAEASSTLNSSESPQVATELLKDAVVQISGAIPDTALKAKDIEGYVLVDKLAEINRSLEARNLTGGLIAYAEVRPYLKEVLDEKTGAHPLLQKEARALLTFTDALIQAAMKAGSPDPIAEAVQADIAQYLPDEPDQVLVSEEALNNRVKEMVRRIFVFKAPRSRYNQLLVEMGKLKGDPNRGTLLRRLYRELPENGVGGYVLTEIKNLGDELKGGN